VTTSIEFPEVLSAVRVYALKQETVIRVDDRLATGLGRALLLDFNERGFWHGDSFKRFKGQVRRAMNKLADEDVLVKNSYLHGALYWEPGAYDRHCAQIALREAGDRAAQDRLGAQRMRLAAFDITSRIEFGRVQLAPDDLDKLLDLAAKGLS
jgi:hypothetical protein